MGKSAEQMTKKKKKKAVVMGSGNVANAVSNDVPWLIEVVVTAFDQLGPPSLECCTLSNSNAAAAAANARACWRSRKQAQHRTKTKHTTDED